MSLKCKACGNDERFLESISATVPCNSDGQYGLLSDADDIWSEGDYSCTNCGSRDIAEENE